MKIYLICTQERIREPQYGERYFSFDSYSATEQVNLFLEYLKHALERGEKDFHIRTSHGFIPNFVGHLINKKLLNCEDISVVAIFPDGRAKIAAYDSEGYLINWPFGFFEYNQESLEIAKTFLKEIK